VQARGYNALSFREIAKDVGIKSASIHYYFPTKGDLGVALAKRYTDDAVGYFESLLAEPLDLETSLPALYRGVPRRPAERQPHVPVRDHGRRIWRPAARGGDRGRPVHASQCRLAAASAGERNRGATDETARQGALAIFAAIEGAQLVARGRGDIAVFDQTIEAYRRAGLMP
jgi:TetR/AcrR family transcriptional repressor of nem operon